MIILEKYEILEEVGRGGMGLVYRARDLRLARTVALKELVINQAIMGQERDDLVARFKREAQTAANLSHPNIITVFDVGEENNRHFIAMEYLPGKTLKDYLDEEHKYSLEDILEILIQIWQQLFKYKRCISAGLISPAFIIWLPHHTVFPFTFCAAMNGNSKYRPGNLFFGIQFFKNAGEAHFFHILAIIDEEQVESRSACEMPGQVEIQFYFP